MTCTVSSTSTCSTEDGLHWQGAYVRLCCSHEAFFLSFQSACGDDPAGDSEHRQAAITEATFASIMRRSLVILCAARFARFPPGVQGTRCGCFDHDSLRCFVPLQCGQFPRKDRAVRGWRRRRPHEGHHAFGMSTEPRNECPQVNQCPAHASDDGLGIAVRAAGQEVESVGSRRVPFVVQSEQGAAIFPS